MVFQEQTITSDLQFHTPSKVKQSKSAARRSNTKEGPQKKAFQPYHAICVPKEVDFGGKKPPSSESDQVTTLMLRNIPYKYSQTALLQEIDQLGFAGSYDFFYLPMDQHNRSNVGYAFINFIDPASVPLCYSVFSNYKFQRYPSKKICVISPAHLQGFKKNVEHFQNSAVMNAHNNQYRPVVLPHGEPREESKTVELDKALFGFFPGHEFESQTLQLDKALFGGAPAFDKHDFVASQGFAPERLPVPQLESGLSSLQEALVELLRKQNIATTQNDTFASQLSSSFHSQEPQWIVPPDETPRGPSKLQKPPGLCLDMADERSFEPDDKTPRTNHSLLGECFGPDNGPTWGPTEI